MAQFTIRDFDDSLFAQLKKLAKINHSSFEAFVRKTLAHALAPDDRKAAIAELAAFRHSFAPPAKENPLALLRADRDA